jgi:hypothetical protein
MMANQNRDRTKRIKQILRDICAECKDEMRAHQLIDEVLRRLDAEATNVKRITLSAFLLNYSSLPDCPYERVKHGRYRAKPAPAVPPAGSGSTPTDAAQAVVSR